MDMLYGINGIGFPSAYNYPLTLPELVAELVGFFSQEEMPRALQLITMEV